MRSGPGEPGSLRALSTGALLLAPLPSNGHRIPLGTTILGMRA